MKVKTEWFRIKYSQAEMLIDGMLEDWCGQKLYYFGAVRPDMLCKVYEADIRDFFEPDPFELERARSFFNNPPD